MPNGRVEEIFEGAISLYNEAIEELERGEIRDAAEKAWGAMVGATKALILARNGVELEGSMQLSKEFINLMKVDEEVMEKLRDRYFARESSLHGHCFYDGLCDPKVEREIKETNFYIEDVRKLAFR